MNTLDIYNLPEFLKQGLDVSKIEDAGLKKKINLCISATNTFTETDSTSVQFDRDLTTSGTDLYKKYYGVLISYLPQKAGLRIEYEHAQAQAEKQRQQAEAELQAKREEEERQQAEELKRAEQEAAAREKIEQETAKETAARLEKFYATLNSKAGSFFDNRVSQRYLIDNGIKGTENNRIILENNNVKYCLDRSKLSGQQNYFVVKKVK